jgi:hypothetical protein
MTKTEVRSFLRGRNPPGLSGVFLPVESEKGKRLEAANNVLAEQGLWLHATRGFRRLNPRTTVAAEITAAIKDGRHITVTQCGKEITFASRHKVFSKKAFRPLRRSVR